MPTQQTLCVLDGFVYLYNPIEQSNPTLISIQHTSTMQGGFDTIWTDPNNGNVPYFLTDQPVMQKWPLIEYGFYNSLQTIVNGAAVVTFVDWFGVNYHVLPLTLVYGSVLKGGALAYTDVVLALRVISQP